MKKFIIGIMMSLCAATSFAQTASDIGVLRARMKICIVQYSSIVKSATMEIRSQNYGLDIEEFMQGLIGIAVPIFNRNNKICGTVSIHIPTVRHDLSEAIACIPKLRIAAEKISQTFSRKDI